MPVADLLCYTATMQPLRIKVKVMRKSPVSLAFSIRLIK
jgi:hypothetical protein